MILKLAHGTLRLPVFLPDATLGVVRAVDSVDLHNAGVQALVMNTYHLMQHPGSSTVHALGGLHTMCGWPQPIITDSGGFQAYSLIRENPKYGKLTEDGLVFKPDGAERKYQLTPEKCVQLQVSYDSDVIMCLDDCTHVDDGLEAQQTSVRRTIAWAGRCKREFQQLMKQKKVDENQRPLLFGVIQGGGSRALRQQCAEALLEIGFDGFGYGGWPLDAEGDLVAEILAYTRELVPRHFPMHALGIGHPVNVAACFAMGYETFDSALPTRDARRGRLYTFTDATTRPTANHKDWLRFIYITDDKHIKATAPLSEFCDCLTCTHYSRGYLHHLYQSNDAAFMRLATLHNLRFMTQLIDRLRGNMILFLSKFLPLFIYPLGLACVLLVLALILRRYRSWQTWLIVLTFVLLWLGGNRLVTMVLVQGLERQYLAPAQLPAQSVIVVLGGATRAKFYPRQLPELQESGDRLLYAAWLYKQGKAAHLLLSGGKPSVGYSAQPPEAEDMATILAIMGVPRTALWLESTSRNTEENAVESRKLLEQKGVNQIVLVTTAIHMPRSVRLFEQQGLTVIPTPTDFQMTDDDWTYYMQPSIEVQLLNLLPSADDLALTSRALKEQMGALYYQLRGWQ